MWKSTRNVLVLISCLLIGSPAYAKTPIEAPELRPGIRVRIYNYAEVPARTLRRAQKQAASVLARAGVATEWLNCRPFLGVEKDPECRKPQGRTDIVLRTLSRSMAEKLEVSPSRFRFGYALQPIDEGFGWMAGVFSYRVEELAKETTLRVDVSTAFLSVVLGHLMAHEIGHLLLGSGGHSSNGIMRSRWRREDLEAAAQGRLGFTARQGEQMREQVRNRFRAEQSATVD